MPGRIALTVDGRDVEVDDQGGSLLEVLRDQLRIRSPKDGCSPQGQCGCCTVLVDGSPRVACVTPARRVAGRSVTTVAGLDDGERWAEAFCSTGASQCGFCTPGIICRLSGLRARNSAADRAAVERSLAGHLCRCTGWRTILEAWDAMVGGSESRLAGGDRDLAAAAWRAAIEGGAEQKVGPYVALGAGGFADDLAPPDALVAVPDGSGGWVVGETLTEARAAAGKVQGRRSTIGPAHPLEVPPGEWDLTLRTTWVEPAYLETDASWCMPGGEPASPLGNAGAFGGKAGSPAPSVARRLADEHGRPVRVLLSREDTVMLGAKRPPVAGGVKADGTGVLRCVETDGIEEAVAAVSAGIRVEQVRVPGPPTSTAIRGAGWMEALVLLAAVPRRRRVDVVAPGGGRAAAEVGDDGVARVWVSAGAPLDKVVMRSYCVGAAHMALSWVRSEGIAVDDDGRVHDLTIRSFGILRASDMPPVEIEIDDSHGPPVNGSEAVMVAVAAADWVRQGCPQDWPTTKRGPA